jgi:hypothetical protein
MGTQFEGVAGGCQCSVCCSYWSGARNFQPLIRQVEFQRYVAVRTSTAVTEIAAKDVCLLNHTHRQFPSQRLRTSTLLTHVKFQHSQ